MRASIREENIFAKKQNSEETKDIASYKKAKPSKIGAFSKNKKNMLFAQKVR